MERDSLPSLRWPAEATPRVVGSSFHCHSDDDDDDDDDCDDDEGS